MAGVGGLAGAGGTTGGTVGSPGGGDLSPRIPSTHPAKPNGWLTPAPKRPLIHMFHVMNLQKLLESHELMC